MNPFNKNITLGILGGLGPMSSAYFYELVTEHTYAECDQDHIDIILSSRATTPDRTAFITGASNDNPLFTMKEEALKLISVGVDVIAIPCNTAHYFYNSLSMACSIPILNIIDLTVGYAKSLNIKNLGIMATKGTISSKSYQNVCQKHGINCVCCDNEFQIKVNEIIYNSIKKGKLPNILDFESVCNNFMSKGCEKIILGCTELSLINKKYSLLGSIFIDALDVLAACTVSVCNKKICGFSDDLTEYASTIKL